MNITRVSTLALAMAALSTTFAKEKPLHIKGYQAALNQLDVSAAPVLNIQFQAAGGVAHLGKMTSLSTDQQVVGDILTATITFNDGSDDLVFSAQGLSQQEPDGRAVFQGAFTVLNGTGKFAHASGTLSFAGWARSTEFVPPVLDGIGFFTFEGDLYGVNVKPDAQVKASEAGTAVFDGVDFVYQGSGKSSHFGKFDSIVQTALQPFDGAFNNQFVGIVDGRFSLVSSFDGVHTHPNGDKIFISGIEFVSWEIVDGGPDFSKPSIAEVYETIDSGTGRFAGAQGVLFGLGQFTPTGPVDISAGLAYEGFMSLPKK